MYHKRFILFILIMVISHAFSLLAADRFSAFLDVDSEYTDNAFWRNENKEEDWINRIMSGFSLKFPGEHKEVNLNYAIGFESYAHNPQDNTITHNVRADTSLKPTEHFDFKISESYVRTSSLAEVDIYSVNRRRETYWQNNVSPSLQYTFGPDRTISCSYRYNMLHFSQTRSQNSTEHTIIGNLTYGIGQRHIIKIDYTFTHGEFASLWGNLNKHSFKLTYGYLLTSHTKVYLFNTYSLNRYTASLDYAVYEGGLGIEHSFTPHISTEITAGMFLFHPEEGNQLTGFSETIKVNYVLKRSQFSLSVEKGTREVLFTTLNLNFGTYWSITASLTYKLTPNLNISTSAGYNKSSYKFVDREDRFWTTSIRLDYTPRKWFSSYISYDYSTLDTNTASYSYDTNRVVLGLRFVY